jgi:predicted RNA binding protein YcfA (HicA-like mRNA interferase family)
MPTTVKDAIRQVQADGWYLARQKGSHRQFAHPTKAGIVTIAGKESQDLAPGTYGNILKQAGLK